MYYPCNENKGADQLRGYREADLRLCFRRCKKPVFSQRGSLYRVEESITFVGCRECHVFQIVVSRSQSAGTKIEAGNANAQDDNFWVRYDKQ